MYSRRRRWLPLLTIAGLLLSLAPVSVGAYEPQGTHFTRTWERTDKPVADGAVSRTWMWGPAFTPQGKEFYVEAPGVWRTVQYFDKSRMEITDPAGDSTSPWFVTNGLLVVEMMTGLMQTGNDSFEMHGLAAINVAGDPDDSDGPTYATFYPLMGAEAASLGSPVTQRVSRGSVVTNDPSLDARGVTIGSYDEITRHAIASVFWDFMNSTGTVWEDGGYANDTLFLNPFYATGRPITEPYWANVRVGGTPKDVLMQCFERRCLTYTPENPRGWQVEAGNVGQHYYTWRYRITGTATPPQLGLLLYESGYDDWAGWPVGSPRAGEPQLLGSSLGQVEKDGDFYTVEVAGGANAWVVARSERGDYGDVMVDAAVRRLNGVANDVSCLLTRVVGEFGDAVASEYRFYAFCLETTGMLVALYYEKTPAGATSSWLIPPGTASVTGSTGDTHHLYLYARGHDFWFSADGDLIDTVHHEPGPLTGAVGVGVVRYTAGPAAARFQFQAMELHLVH